MSVFNDMHLDDVIERLRDLNEPTPKPARLPTEAEVTLAEQKLNFEFPADYHQFLLQASDVVYGTVEPAQVTPGAGHLDLVKMAKEAWSLGVPEDWLPFCESNGDYFCINAEGHVFYWHHNGSSDEEWSDLAHWITEVWLGEEDADEDDE